MISLLQNNSRILAIFATLPNVGDSLEEYEIKKFYKSFWPDDFDEKEINKSLFDLISQNYLRKKKVYGRDFYWLTAKGIEMVKKLSD